MADGQNGRVAFVTSTTPRYNFTAIKRAANQFEIVLPKHVYPDMADQIEGMKRHASEVLARFDPNRDVLLLGGDPVAMVIATQILALKGVPITVGKYDRDYGDYFYFQI